MLTKRERRNFGLPNTAVKLLVDGISEGLTYINRVLDQRRNPEIISK